MDTRKIQQVFDGLSHSWPPTCTLQNRWLGAIARLRRGNAGREPMIGDYSFGGEHLPIPVFARV
jgi:hypothetical protein